MTSWADAFELNFSVCPIMEITGKLVNPISSITNKVRLIGNKAVFKVSFIKEKSNFYNVDAKRRVVY